MQRKIRERKKMKKAMAPSQRKDQKTILLFLSKMKMMISKMITMNKILIKSTGSLRNLQLDVYWIQLLLIGNLFLLKINIESSKHAWMSWLISIKNNIIFPFFLFLYKK